MNHRILAGLVVCLFAGPWACSTKRASQQLVSSDPRWTGVIRAVERRTGAVTTSSLPAMFNGTVLMTRDEDNSTRSRIKILLSGPEPNRSMAWALLPDRCGTAGVPVLPVSLFHPLELGSNGRAEANVSVPIMLPTDGTYHVNVYIGNQAALSDVVACANLSYKVR